MTNSITSTKTRTLELVQIAVMAAVMAVCAWITVPYTVPFTMQTFGVFLTLKLLGGRNGTLSVLIYILLGAVGVPVFSGFGAGLGYLAGPTGGYIVGFVVCGLFYWVVTSIRRSAGFRISEEDSTLKKLLGSDFWVLLIGLGLLYLFGTLWFVFVKGRAGSPMGFASAAAICVVPYIIPDVLKLLLANFVASRVSKALRRS